MIKKRLFNSIVQGMREAIALAPFICTTCGKDFSSYHLETSHHCARCNLFVPFSKGGKAVRRRNLQLEMG
jgi:hypothetical protein